MRPTRRALVLGLLAASLGAVAPAVSSAATAGQTFLASPLPLPAGAIAGGNSGFAPGERAASSVSADGRFVAFVSEADLLDPAAPADLFNVFRKDRETGAVVLVSRANGPAGAAAARSSSAPRISDDGSRVAFATAAALDPADVDGVDDVYVRDLSTGATLLASRGNGAAEIATPIRDCDLSGDGRFVAFATLGIDANGGSDVYRRDLAVNTTVLASATSGTAVPGNSGSGAPSISDDGRWVAFVSSATDLAVGYVPGGAGGQVYARDIQRSTTLLVSSTTTSPQIGSNGVADAPDVAGTPGATASVTVAYESRATNVAVDDGNPDRSSFPSVYVRTLSSTVSTLVSRGDGVGSSADGVAGDPSISDDGKLVAYTSAAGNLGARAGTGGVYLRNLATADTLLVSTDGDAAAGADPTAGASIADNGSFVAWVDRRGVTPDSDPLLNGVFGRAFSAPAALGGIQFVSRPPGGAPFVRPSSAVAPIDGDDRSISADGRFLVFKAHDPRLPGFNATDGFDAAGGQIYRRDLLTGAIALASRADGPAGAAIGATVSHASISADGTRVAFTTAAPIAPMPTSGEQVYVRDLTTGTTTFVSRADGRDGAPANGGATSAIISADGRHVVFGSGASNLGAPDGDHLFLRDLANSRTLVVDRGAGGAIADEGASAPSLSADGRWVAFVSDDPNLVPDRPRGTQVYVRDTVVGVTTLVSRRNGADGVPAAVALLADGAATAPSLSADGRVVAFETADERLAPEAGPWGGVTQIVARDLVTHRNTLVSRAPGGRPADAFAGQPSVSGDGGTIAFASPARDLGAGLGGERRVAVFARSMTTGALSAPPAFGVDVAEGEELDGARSPSLSDDGRCLAFFARGHNAVSGVAGDFVNAYVHVVSGSCGPDAPAGPPGPPPGPPAPPVPPARGAGPAKPVLSRVSLSRRTFRVGKAATAKSAVAKRRAAKPAPAGTTFRFTLNAAARVSIALERPTAGRRVGRACRRATAKLLRRPRCDLFAAVATLTRAGGRAGVNSVAFSGRVGRKALKPGRYRASLRATNAAGASSTVRVTFTVVR